MKTGERREDSGLAMTYSHGTRRHYITIGDLTKEMGTQVATVAAQIFCLASRRTVVVTRNGAGRIEHEVIAAIVGVPRRDNGCEQDEEGKDLGDKLHGGDESSVSPLRLSNPQRERNFSAIVYGINAKPPADMDAAILFTGVLALNDFMPPQ